MLKQTVVILGLLVVSFNTLADRVTKQCWPLDMDSINLQNYVDAIKNPSGGGITHILNLGGGKVINIPNLFMERKGGYFELFFEVSAQELFVNKLSVLEFADNPDEVPPNSRFGKKRFFSENQKVLSSNEYASDLGCKYDINYLALGNYNREDYEPEPDEAQSIVGYLFLQMIENQHSISYGSKLETDICHAPLSVKEYEKLLDNDRRDYKTGKTFTVRANFIEAKLSNEEQKNIKEVKLLLPYLKIPSPRYGIATIPLYGELTRNHSSVYPSSYVVSPPVQTKKIDLGGYGSILLDFQGVKKRYAWLQENGYIKTGTETYKEHYVAEIWEQTNPSHCFNYPVKLISYKGSSPTLFVMDANPNLWKHMIDSLMTIYTPSQEEIDSIELEIYQGDIERLKKY